MGWGRVRMFVATTAAGEDRNRAQCSFANPRRNRPSRMRGATRARQAAPAEREKEQAAIKAVVAGATLSAHLDRPLSRPNLLALAWDSWSDGSEPHKAKARNQFLINHTCPCCCRNQLRHGTRWHALCEDRTSNPAAGQNDDPLTVARLVWERMAAKED